MNRFGTRTGRFVVMAAALLLVAGCGGTGTLNGKVTFKGQPLPGGMVTVFDAGNAGHSGQIQKDGSYSVSNIPAGSAKVTVGTSPSRGNIRNPDAVKEPWGPYVQIPRRYSDPEKSGFKLEVKSGTQEMQLDVKDDFEPGEDLGKQP
jgi:hypothetical protein